MSAAEQSTEAVETTGRVLSITERAAGGRPEPSMMAGDLADARLVDRLAEDMLPAWRHTGSGWMRWSGIVWERAADTVATEGVREHLLAVYEEAVAEAGAQGEAGATLARAAARLLRTHTVEGLARLVRGPLAADLADFDADPDVLVTVSGVVDLRTGEVSEHSPERLVTRHTPVAYHAGATHDAWDRALEAIPDPEVRGWLQIRAGQAATGHTPDDDRVTITRGGGANGKSTVLGAVADALGGYAVPLPRTALIGTRGDRHPTELMPLRGARLALAEELPEGRHLDMGAIKGLVGTDEITARPMRGDFVTWTASHTLWITTNFVPEVAETDRGTWRRLAMLKFPLTYMDREPRAPHERRGDPGVRRALRDDPAAREAVLAWIVEGAVQWYAAGRRLPEPPETVRRDTAAWRRASDVALRFATDRLEAAAASCILLTDLTRELAVMLQAQGSRPWSEKLVRSRLLEHEVMQGWGTTVGRARTATLQGLSRPPLGGGLARQLDLPAQATVVRGVRWRTTTD